MKYIEMLLAGVGLAYCILFGNFSLAERKESVSNHIYYDNVQYTDNIDFYGVDGLAIRYAGNLFNPGDYYELSFDVVNSGNADVEIAQCTYQDSDEYIEYQLTYEDGEEIMIGDTLKKGERKRLKYRVLYKNFINTSSYEFDSSFYLSYEQVL